MQVPTLRIKVPTLRIKVPTIRMKVPTIRMKVLSIIINGHNEVGIRVGRSSEVYKRKRSKSPKV